MTRREALKITAGLSGFSTLFAGTADAEQSADPTDVTVTSEVNATINRHGESPSRRQQRIVADVVDEGDETLTLESTIDGYNARTFRVELPKRVFDRPIRGEKRRSGNRTVFVRDSGAPVDGSRVHIKGVVEDGFFTEVDVRSVDTNHGTIRYDIAATDVDGPGFASDGSGVVLLPRFISPAIIESELERIGQSATTTTSAGSTSADDRGGDAVTVQATTRNANSTLTTRDNATANLVTAQTKFAAKANDTGSTFNSGTGAWQYLILFNWGRLSAPVTVSHFSDRAVVSGQALFEGTFPWGLYVTWRDTHLHTHTIRRTGHNTLLRGTIIKRKLGGSVWESHKTNTFHDGSKLYSAGSTQTGSWFIV